MTFEKPALFFFYIFVAFKIAGFAVQPCTDSAYVLAVNMSTGREITPIYPSDIPPYPWASNGELKSISVDIGS